MQLKVNGIDTRYVLSNEGGGPWLTFIHQLGGDLSVWDQLAGYFRNDFTVLGYDVRGHGKTSAPTGHSPLTIFQTISPRCSMPLAQKAHMSSACRWAVRSHSSSHSIMHRASTR